MRAMLVSVAVLLLLASGAAKADSIVNGGFETGDFTGWTLAGAGVASGVPNPTYVGVIENVGPHSGNYNAYLADPSGLTYLYQTFATVPGQTYVVSFWYAQQPPPQNPPANQFEVYAFLDVSSPATSLDPLFSVTNESVHPWTYVQETFTATEAASGIVFAAENGPGWFALDDVDVKAPEPQAMLLCGLGLGLVGFLRRGARARS